MAAKLDSLTVTARSSRLENIKWKLQEVDCPFIAEDDESWMLSLFEPCEARTRLISWLVTKFDQKFGEMLSRQIPSVDNRIESRVQRMLFICNFMGICKADDLELIKGTASKKKQVKFWENLLEMVVTAEKSKFATKTENSSLDLNSFPQKTHSSDAEVFETTCRFIDNLVRREQISELFASSVTLFPPDLEKVYKEGDGDKKYRLNAPDNTVLQDLIGKLSLDVEKTEKDYNRIMEKHKCPELEQNELDSYCKKLSLTITMLNQLITNFLHCYESELRHWCNRPKVKKSGIGPASKATFQMMTQQNELFMQMEVLENAYLSLENKISKDISGAQPDADIGHDALMNLRQVIDILRESEIRINETL